MFILLLLFFFNHSLSILFNIFAYCLVLLAVLVCTLNCLDVEMHNINKRNLSLSENRDFVLIWLVHAAKRKKSFWNLNRRACVCALFGMGSYLLTLFSPQRCSSDPSSQSLCPSHTLSFLTHEPSLHRNSSCSWQGGREWPAAPEAYANTQSESETTSPNTSILQLLGI